MNLLPNHPLLQGLAPQEKFFLELWHSMTHELSLDSHRVRCLNSRTILRELEVELHLGRLQPEELVDLCAEAQEILQLDPVVQNRFAQHSKHLLPLLQEFARIPQDKKKEKETSADPKLREFKFLVADFSAALERDYFKRLLDTLPDAIASGDQTKIHSVVGSLLSDLVDQGWPLESLFAWLDLFSQKKREPHGTFNGNLRFLIRQLDWGKQPFRVVLRLSGSTKLAGFGSFEGFQFRAAPGFAAHKDAEKKFAETSQLVAFAETQVEAVDFNSAAIIAREEFEQCLDRMRFNFEPSPLKVDRRCFAERGDKRVEIVAVRQLVPNPTQHLTAEAFREFSDDINAILSRSSIEAETAERLRAAIRHYRFGRDADSYKDKFLSWWMGLEFMAHVSQGETIGRTVMRHASDPLLQRYLHRLLSDLLRTLIDDKIPWSPDLENQSGCAKLEDLKIPELIRLYSNHSNMPKSLPRPSPTTLLQPFVSETSPRLCKVL